MANGRAGCAHYLYLNSRRVFRGEDSTHKMASFIVVVCLLGRVIKLLRAGSTAFVIQVNLFNSLLNYMR